MRARVFLRYFLFACLVIIGIASIIATGGGGGNGGNEIPPVPLSAALPSSLAITPANPSVPVGATQQLAAASIYPDSTQHDITAQVTWSSSDTSVATISTSGLVTGVAVGTTTITATLASLSGSTTLIVPSLSSITVTPANPSVPLRTTQQFTATGNYSDGATHNITNQVTWSSSDTSVATISTSGLATALALGTTTIMAAYGGKSGSTTLTVTSVICSPPTSPFTRPILLGVSGGNINDVSVVPPYIICSSGTLGALVQDGSAVQYILSNNHVLARSNSGNIGDLITEPGLVDTSCSQVVADQVGTLAGFIPLDFTGTPTPADAAIAQVVPGKVSTDGYIDCVGTVSPTVRTLTAGDIGLAVQKNGRTSGLTSGTVSSINATVSVCYDSPTCSNIALFTNQILITPGTFSASGDSGSLIVTQPASGCPQPVGLLYAGSAVSTAANPIQTVLDAFHSLGLSLTVVGTCTGVIAPEVTLSAEQATKVANLKAVQAVNEPQLMAIAGVVGMGIGRSEDGKSIVFEIYVKTLTPELEQTLPKSLDGVTVRIVETGEFRAF